MNSSTSRETSRRAWTRRWATVWLLGLLLPSVGFASDLAQGVASALAAEGRSDRDRARDANRKPLETLEFFGLEPDMRVVEIFPGGGWYTRILVPVLADKGEYYAAGGLGKAYGFGEILGRLRKEKGFEELNVIDLSPKLKSSGDGRLIDMAPVDFGVKKVDLVLTARNLHNLTVAARAELYKATRKALRRGGRFAVIDHTRRHMQPDTAEVWRRLDPVLVIQEISQSGFKFVAYSDLHHRPDDELRYEVGRRSVKGNTDRFTLLFEKE